MGGGTRSWTCFAVAAPGLEAVLSDEVAALPGVLAPRTIEGGVEFSGPLELCWSANLWLRTATRVLVRLGELEAHDFARLRRRGAKLDWAPFVAPEAPIAVHATTSRCRLYHTGAIAEHLEQAVSDTLGRQGPSDPDAPPVGVHVRGVGDRFTVSIDASGELLHRRGWRPEGAAAPLRETLAAGLLALCDWDPATPLVDPMCGSGTIPIEAALRALGRAPGLDRAFAFQRWPSFNPTAWARLREAALRQERPAPAAAIVGSDAAPMAIESARRNAERAGVLSRLRLEVSDLTHLQPPPSTPGLVLTNAPYGRRVGASRSLAPLYRDLGRTLRMRFPGWRVGVLHAEPRLADRLGLSRIGEHPLVNGGLRVTLAVFEVPSR